MKNRKGFALIYTVLISVLVLVSIVGLTMKIIPERAITNARTHSQRALLTAEAGASQVLFDLRNFGTNPDFKNDFDPNSGPSSSHYLTPEDITSLITTSGGIINPSNGEQITNPSPPSDESFETSYQAKIKVNSNDTTNKILDVDLYILGTVSDRSNNELAREAIKTNFEVTYKIESYTEQTWIDGTTAGIFNYALFSGGDIVFGGSAQTVTGDIHAIGSIDLGNAKNQVRVGGGGNAEAEGNITGKGIVTGESIVGATSVPFPMLNIDAYKTLADAFRSGDAPYNGDKPNFPNTNDPIVLSVIQSYLGAPGTSSTLTGIQNFYNDLKGKTGAFGNLTVAQWQNLITYAKNIVYYIQGDVHINGQFECIGTLVIDGDLIINGSSQVGDPTDPGAAAILVNGDVNLSNGTADLYGLFYTAGEITGRGTFYCEGSIAARGAIDLSGNYEVKYHPVTNENLGVDTPGHWEDGDTHTYYSVESAAGSSSTPNPNAKYTWTKISYDEFINAH